MKLPRAAKEHRSFVSARGIQPFGEWHRFANEELLSEAVSERLAGEVRKKQDSLICLATGASPKRTYELLAAKARKQPSLFEKTRWMKLDEWGGLAMDDPASCEYFLRQTLLNSLAVPPERYFGWISQPANTEEECDRVAEWLKANGPIDIQVLGLGENGHLGFNEPAQELQSGPHVAELSAVSMGHSMLANKQGKVAFGLTLGMNDILSARQIILLVSGERKSKQLLRLATGEESPQFPA
ncbi:MAG: 6-phosphogluconolactonase, partial [Verrucomicrobiae bacterium]|nr:6-phosphogluconolactonase [Verrucomicrobiae bacterium]